MMLLISYWSLLTAVMIMFIMAVALGLVFLPVRSLPDSEPDRSCDNDNIRLQGLYVIKLIDRADNEDKLWHAARQIRHFEDTFHDHPEVYKESEALKEYLKEKVRMIYIDAL